MPWCFIHSLVRKRLSCPAMFIICVEKISFVTIFGRARNLLWGVVYIFWSLFVVFCVYTMNIVTLCVKSQTIKWFPLMWSRPTMNQSSVFLNFGFHFKRLLSSCRRITCLNEHTNTYNLIVRIICIPCFVLLLINQLQISVTFSVFVM